MFLKMRVIPLENCGKDLFCGPTEVAEKGKDTTMDWLSTMTFMSKSKWIRIKRGSDCEYGAILKFTARYSGLFLIKSA